MASTKIGTTTINNIKVGLTQIKKAYIGVVKVWQYWVYNSGTLATAYYNVEGNSSDPCDGTGSSVSLGGTFRIKQVYISIDYYWGEGTGTTSYGAAIAGYNVATSTWEDLGSFGGSTTNRPVSVVRNETINVSTNQLLNEYSHIRASGWGGAYCTHKYVTAQVKQWYAQG